MGYEKQQSGITILVGAMMMSLNGMRQRSRQRQRRRLRQRQQKRLPPRLTRRQKSTTAEAAKTDDGKQFKIGVLQLAVQHSALMRQNADLSRR